MEELHKEEDTISKKINFGVWKKLYVYIKHNKLLIFLIVLFSATSSLVFNSFEPLLTKAVIEAVQNGTIYPSFELSVIPFSFLGIKVNLNLITFSITLFAVNFIKYVTYAIAQYLTFLLSANIIVSIRKDCFKKIQELSFSYFDKTPSGWLIARVQSDTKAVADTLVDSIVMIFWGTIDLVFAGITMFIIDWKLSLVICGCLLFFVFFLPYFERVNLKKSRAVRAVSSNYIAWVSECITGNKTIKALNLSDLAIDEGERISRTIRSRTIDHRYFSSIFWPIFSVLRYSSVSIITLIVALIVANGGNENSAVLVATIVVFIGFISKIFNPFTDIIEQFNNMLANQPSLEKIDQLLSTEIEIVDSSDKELVLEDNRADITFNHVRFSYGNDIEVLHDSNFTIKKGTSVAIVGETGSGKSTTVNLLCRFYEPTHGQILIDGVDYREFSVASFRKVIGYVQQNPIIFNGSIADNIRYGKLDASFEEIVRAAKSVSIHDYIMALPKGYDTIITGEGSEMSTGQKQLISFARALIRDPSIMILDEATSSIDTETEIEVQKAIEAFLPGRTTIIIAHRLSTIVSCNRILVMKNGSIVEDGNHQELMGLKGYYYSLYMKQFEEMTIDSQLFNAKTVN